MTETAGTLLALTGVEKVYRAQDLGILALTDVHFRVEAGEYVAISGPSGSGKTSLLSILGLLDVPSSGTYSLAGRDVMSLSRGARAQVRNRLIGFIFQSFNLIGNLSVFENVELPLTYRDMGADERRERVLRALERVGMGHRRTHAPSQLSGGQQQRVAVARAIAGDPLVLLADEPTGNLDSKNADVVMALLRELPQGGATICMVTHNPSYARQATRQVHLFDGRIVDEEARVQP